MTLFSRLFIFLFVFLALNLAFAQESTPIDLAKTLESLTARVDRLESAQATQTQNDEGSEASEAKEKITELRLEMKIPETLNRRFTGLGPGASQVYYAKTPLSIGGFGEVQYTSEERRNTAEKRTQIAHVSAYLGHRFSQSLIFNSSLTLDNEDNEGEGMTARLTFAYLDLLWGEESGVRIGNILLPIGLINLRLEPNTFAQVRRPRAEMRLIPSTWNENGILLFHKWGPSSFQLGIFSAGDASEFTASNWIRDGRQAGILARAESAAVAGRYEIASPEADESTSHFGISFYSAESVQDRPELGPSQTFIGAVHGGFQISRLSLDGLYSEGTLNDTERIFTLNGQVIGSRTRGGFATLSFDILPHIAPLARAITRKSHSPDFKELPLFVSYEFLDLHAEVAPGQVRNPTLRRSWFTLGANYKPHPQVIIKANFVYEEDAENSITRAMETGIGYVF